MLLATGGGGGGGECWSHRAVVAGNKEHLRLVAAIATAGEENNYFWQQRTFVACNREQ